MSDFGRSGLTMQRPPKRRSTSSRSRFGDLGDRLSRTFGGVDRTRTELPAWEAEESLDYPMVGDTVAWPPIEQRFPAVPQGYDPDAVDQHIDALERELDELRAGQASGNAVAAEFDRIGEQTAAILRTAYEQAEEITREAREQAEKCIADASANAVSITDDANRRLRQLDLETDAVWQERTRLLEDARGVASALMTLADRASERFPADGPKSQRQPTKPAPRPQPEAVQPAPAPVSASEPAEPEPVEDSQDERGSIPPPSPADAPQA